jgi:quercetin dioxygenase-like cupin family protein
MPEQNINSLDLATGVSFPMLPRQTSPQITEAQGASMVAAMGVNDQYGRMYVLEKAGQANHGHSHTFDHMTWLVRGSVLIESDQNSWTAHAPMVIMVPKLAYHKFTALEDHTTYICTHVVDGDFQETAEPGRLVAGLIESRNPDHRHSETPADPQD